MMKSLQDAGILELEWSHPHFLKRMYELHAGDELFASLRWESPFSSLAIAETADGRWTFKREGFFRSHVVVRQAESNEEVASIKRNMGGSGVLRLADGQSFKWTNISFWRGEWAWINNDGVPLLRLNRGKKVIIEHLALWQSEFPLSLLIVLGWYLIRIQQEDATAAASSVG